MLSSKWALSLLGHPFISFVLVAGVWLYIRIRQILEAFGTPDAAIFAILFILLFSSAVAFAGWLALSAKDLPIEQIFRLRPRPVWRIAAGGTRWLTTVLALLALTGHWPEYWRMIILPLYFAYLIEIRLRELHLRGHILARS